jgi:NADH dehydrogenase
MARILVLGAGFAGLWAAVGAARKRHEIGAAPGEFEILVVDRNAYHNIRVRNYELDLSDVAIPLREVLDPIGVNHVTAEVHGIDLAKQQVRVTTSDGEKLLAYDRLVLALGSELVRPEIPGLAEHAFDVDTYGAAIRLNDHIAALSSRPDRPDRSTVVVVGAGFTGIEVATEMPRQLARSLPGCESRVILVDPNPVVGATIGGSGASCNLRRAFGAQHRDPVGNEDRDGQRIGHYAFFGRGHRRTDNRVVRWHARKPARRKLGDSAGPLGPRCRG